MKKKYFIICLATVWVFFSPFLSGAEEKPWIINCTIHSPYEAFFFRLVEEVCARNGILVERKSPPVGRSLIRVNEGVDDGDGPRIGGLSSTYPNMVCISEPFGNFVFGAFTKSKSIHINGWEDLSDVNVAYIMGWKIFDRQVTKAKSITRVRDKDLLFRLMDANRTDVVLITKFSGYAMIQKLGLNGVRFIEPPLAVVPNYLYWVRLF